MASVDLGKVAYTITGRPPSLEQIQRVIFSRKRYGIGVGEAVRAGDVLLNMLNRPPRADVIWIDGGSMIHLRAVVSGPEHRQTFVRLDEDRRRSIVSGSRSRPKLRAALAA